MKIGILTSIFEFLKVAIRSVISGKVAEISETYNTEIEELEEEINQNKRS
jgi:hypothetical protein